MALTKDVWLRAFHYDREREGGMGDHVGEMHAAVGFCTPHA